MVMPDERRNCSTSAAGMAPPVTGGSLDCSSYKCFLSEETGEPLEHRRVMYGCIVEPGTACTNRSPYFLRKS